jgi:UDP-N-acetylglucosamine 3-dehydrogenase
MTTAATPIRAGVVGLGVAGRTHAEVYATEPGSRLEAVCDKHAEKRDAVRERFGCRTYATIEEMLSSEELDLVSICTAGREGGSAHYAPALTALEAGTHVLVEKPLSNDLGEAERLVRLADEKGLVLATNFNHRFVGTARTAKQWITEGRLGEVLLVGFQLCVGNSNDDSAYTHLRELHPHSFDMLRYFGGEISRLQAFLTRSEGRKNWSTCSVNVQFASGAVGTLHGSYDMSTRHGLERLEVSGTAGKLVVDNVYERLAFYPHTSDEAVVITNPVVGGIDGFNATYRGRIKTLLDELIGGTRPVSASGLDGYAAQQLVEASITSFEREAIVEVPSPAALAWPTEVADGS